MKEQDLSKLPKWAQRKIEVAEMREKEYTHYLAQLAGQEETNVFMRRVFEGVPLPKDSTIVFRLPSGSITCFLRGDELELYADSAMTIHPKGGNSISVLSGR